VVAVGTTDPLRTLRRGSCEAKRFGVRRGEWRGTARLRVLLMLRDGWMDGSSVSVCLL